MKKNGNTSGAKMMFGLHVEINVSLLENRNSSNINSWKLKPRLLNLEALKTTQLLW